MSCAPDRPRPRQCHPPEKTGWRKASARCGPPNQTTQPPGAARKRRQIQRAAVGQFLRDGYAGTSVDQLAAAAKVSKQTLYKHFGSKEDLFLAIVAETVGEVLDELFHRIELKLGHTGDLETELYELGRRYLQLIMRPEFLALRRLVISEAARFPQIGQIWRRGGPARVTAELAPQLKNAADAGHLALDDPALAAEQFTWLVLSIPLNAVMLAGPRHYTAAELNAHADAGVRTFLAAYRPASPANPTASHQQTE